MSKTVTKRDVLNGIDESEQLWNRLVRAVGPEYAEVPGATGDWTFKDVAAHINGWRVSSANNLESFLDGKERPEPWPSSIDPEDIDGVNDWIYQQNRDRPYSDILAETAALYQRIRSAVKSAPDDKLFDPSCSDEGGSYGERIASGDFFSHLTDEHWPEITEWLASLGIEGPNPA